MGKAIYKFYFPIYLLILVEVGSVYGQLTSNVTLKFHPVTYKNGPSYGEQTHAYIKISFAPVSDINYFNLRINDPDDGSFVWLIKNLPIPVFDDHQTIFYRVNTEFISGPYSGLIGEYVLSPNWIENENFVAESFLILQPIPLEFDIASGSNDPALDVPPILPPYIIPPKLPPFIPGMNYRGCQVPNIDLDTTSQDPTAEDFVSDYNACGPAAAANSIQWLMENDPYLMSFFDEFTLREKLDSLKKYMSLARRDSNGVRFDSMVVGKLTLIDKLMLPIRVKYNTKHESGYPDSPLASEVSDYGHFADNQGTEGKNPGFDWFKKEMDDNEDVEIHVGWYDPPDANGKRKRKGGHWLVATGYFDGGESKGIFVKHDVSQSKPDSNIQEFFEWDTLVGGWPYLANLTDSEGRIAVVESFVSESYDPNIQFSSNIDEFDFSYHPIEYLEGNFFDYPFHAWLKFNIPFSAGFNFLNAIICHPDTTKEAWILKNVPLFITDSDLPVRVKMDLSALACGDTLPDKLIMKFHIGELMGQDTFSFQSMIILCASPELNVIGDGRKPENFHPLFPKPFFPPIVIVPSLEIKSILRGCEVPNIDLDSMVHPFDPDNPNTGDWNSCGPAAISNSLQWLDDQHDEFSIPLTHREILDSIKKYTGYVGDGTFFKDEVMGKLWFIDKYKLPLHVKYQAHSSAPSEILSPEEKYGHKAVNASDTMDNGDFLHPTFEWLCQELENEEDIEIAYGNYCDTIIDVLEIDTIIKSINMDGSIMCDTQYITVPTKFLDRKGAHVINVTGKVQVGDYKWITYKHDVFQAGEGGTSRENSPGLRFTDMSEWVEVDGGYAYLKNENYIETDGDSCTCFVETIMSTSYDPDIEFCIEDASLPNDSGEGSLREALACCKDGDTIRISTILAGDTIRLTSGPITIAKNVTIIVDPAGTIYISGESQSRIFEIMSGANVHIEGLKIICGTDVNARCIKNDGNLTLKDMQFENSGDPVLMGSMIENNGNLKIEGTTNIKE